MKIGIDITSLIYGRGVSRYTNNLVKALAKYTSARLSLFGTSFRQHRFLQNQAKQLLDLRRHQQEIKKIPLSLHALAWRFGVNKLGNSFPDLDLFHSWDWLQPPDKNIPLVSTIHDLAILKYPETAHSRVVKAHRRSWEILRERQAHIIAVSYATKKDIVELLNFPNWLIHVIPEALPTEIRQVSENMTEEEYEQIKDKLQLTKPYILFVGTREPRKNLERLIKAWQPLAKDFELIVVGARGWDKSQQMKQPHLRFLGRVSDRQLNVLYAQAEMFAYPSLYEGFGLPILEAFYHGTPVITSDLSAMMEVAGNAAQLVNPESVASIRQAIETIANETQEEQQKRLQRMIIRLQMFSWQKVAQQTMVVYRQAVEHAADRDHDSN